MTGLNFGEALALLKEGKQVTRLAWSGPMRLGYTHGVTVVEAHKRVTTPFIFVRTAGDTISPWVPSQADILAEDWGIA